MHEPVCATLTKIHPIGDKEVEIESDSRHPESTPKLFASVSTVFRVLSGFTYRVEIDSVAIVKGNFQQETHQRHLLQGIHIRRADELVSVPIRLLSSELNLDCCSGLDIFDVEPMGRWPWWGGKHVLNDD